jgi:hypothetical protein
MVDEDQIMSHDQNLEQMIVYENFNGKITIGTIEPQTKL